MPKRWFKDAQTGLDFVLFTDNPVPTRKFYFSMNTWTTDDRWLLCQECRPEGVAVHKILEETGEDVLLVENAVCFGTDRRRDIGYYLSEQALMEIDVQSGAARPVAELPKGYKPQGHYTVSKSGLVVNTYKEDGGIYALMVTDPTTGRSERVYRSDGWLGHCQFCPGDDDTIFYVHETGGDALQRMWMYSISERITRPFFVERDGDWITHETWDEAGEEVSFIRWPYALMAGRKDGQFFRTVAEGEYHHAAPNPDRTLYAADRTFHGQILLVDGQSGRETLLLTDQFAKTGEDHCHPSFNRAGNKIAFSAPQGGICQLGMIDLAQLS